MSDSHELKALQTRLRDAQADESAAQVKLLKAQKEAYEAKTYREGIERRIKELQDAARDPIISEHALLRYVERFMDVNLDEVRQAILTESTVNAIKFMRSGEVLTEGRRLIVKNGVVVTVEPIAKRKAA